MSDPVVIAFDLETQATVAETWAVLSDTDAFNRVAGFGYEFTEKRGPGGIVRTGTLHKLGMTITWDERPWSFRAPQWWRTERVFHSGPAERLVAELHLDAFAGGTKIHYEVRVTPRSSLYWPVVEMDARATSRPQLERALKGAIAWLDKKSDGFDRPPPLSAAAEKRLSDVTATLHPRVALGIRELVLRAPLARQQRLRPLEYAKAWGLREAEVVSGFLAAVEKGALELRFELLCPSCRGPKASLDAWPDRARAAHCTTCDIRFDASFPDAVEIVFRPQAAVRTVEVGVDCLLSPARTPHVVLSEAIAAGVVAELPMEVPVGGYQVVAEPAGTAVIEVADAAAGVPTQAVMELTDGQFFPASVRVAKGGKVSITSDIATHVQVQDRERSPGSLTASRMMSLGLFPALPAGSVPHARHVETARGVVLAIDPGLRKPARLVERMPGAAVTRSDGRLLIATFADVETAVRDAKEVASRDVGIAVGEGVVHTIDGVPMGPTVDSALTALRRHGLGHAVGVSLETPTRTVLQEAGIRFAKRDGEEELVFPRRPAPPGEGAKLDTIGKFRVVGKLGAGAFGEVYEAVSKDGMKVAIKVLKPSACESSSSVQRFCLEARILGKLRSMHLVGLIGAGVTSDERLYVAMERLEGEPLDKVFREGRATPLAARTLGVQVLRGLEVAHGAGVIHRDLKPANLFRCAGGVIKILDFGIARAEGDEVYEKAGTLVGSPKYMAPEQLSDGVTTAQSDLYALGLVLYEGLSGTFPFLDASGKASVTKRMSVAARPITDHVDVPGPLAAIVMKALAPQASERFADASDMRRALEAWTSG